MRKTTPNNRKGYILRLRQSRTFRGISVMLALSLIFEMIRPTAALALTEGPSQPEVQSFEPIGTTQMVDLFTGDFNYNIPLFNLPGPNGGYPVNLAYHAGVSMDDEASWVGLGWNLNVGALVRNMRGLPDEFLSTSDADGNWTGGDYVKSQMDMKQSWTLGMSVSFENELFGGNPLPDTELSASVYLNNYRGVGVTLQPSWDIGGNKCFDLGLSIDSENGLGVNVSFDDYGKNAVLRHKLGVNFGGDISLDYGIESSMSRDKKEGGLKESSGRGKMSESLSFARANFSPSISHRKNFYSFSGSLALKGALLPFLQAGAPVTINYSTEDYSNADKKGRNIPVVGFDRQGDISSYDEYFTSDFSREKDGMLTRQSIMLASAFGNYDFYNSTGQGLAGFFRPHRNDIGRYFDPHIHNHSTGGSIGYDNGLGITNMVGFDFSANYGFNSVGTWNKNNSLNKDYLPTDQKGLKENLYYKAHGETTIVGDKNDFDSDLSFIGRTELAKVRLEPKNTDGLSGGKRKIDDQVSFQNDGHDMEDRFARNTLIHELKNKEVANLGEFDIRYYSNGADIYGKPNQTLNRSTRGNSVNIGEHKAGFKVLNEEGSYYVYALPAYNNKEVDNLFSVEAPTNYTTPGDKEFATIELNSNGDAVDYKAPKSHKFINRTEKSPYAHSYLLTSVQGADYVDITNNGPTDDDLGYWVKFDYVKHSDDYKWRVPYHDNKAQFDEGENFQVDDDKGSYKYGEKEIWYMGRMETKSHIAIFVTSDNRSDNREAAGELGDGSATGTDHGRKLDKIQIYEKGSFLKYQNDPNLNIADLIPLQEVHFTYNYTLCPPGAYGHSNTGKLTLESIHFRSMGSTRGDKSKYLFEYGLADTEMYGSIDRNPQYETNSYDPWGTYRPKGAYDHYKHFPYTNQFNQWGTSIFPYTAGASDEVEKKESQQMANAYASMWCLDKITLPSGGEINVKYESDDYGYVQHKTANQMFKIFQIGDEPDGSTKQRSSGRNEVYLKGYKNNNDNNENAPYYNINTREDEVRRRIFFHLEEPISGTPYQKAEEVYEKYVEPMIVDEGGQRNLYFKSRMELTDKVKDYVSGYLPLEEARYKGLGENHTIQDDYNYGVHETNPNIGFVTIKASQKKKKENGQIKYFEKYHPMAMAAWTYLQTNAQQLLNNPNSFGNAPLNDNNFMGKVADMFNVVPQLMSSLGGIRKYCKLKNMARYIDLDKSCIRLASPDKKKFGGGHRVKEISITDNWSADTNNGSTSENDRTYGQHYEYTIEENGETISSGVAQYEPQAGGDENALKYPIFFQGKTNFFTRNNLFAEAPINESLFPGASVGYRQVEVTSINTRDQRKRKTLNNSSDQPYGRTGGVTRHEFYTAKDFPTMFSYSKLSEDLNTKSTFNVPIPIPFVGSIKRNSFHGTQAFLIETNDMHGKPKSVKAFELNDYKVNSSPITESSYEYQSVPITYQGENVLKLDNHVKIIPNDGSHTMTANADHLLGVEVDLFTDQRETKNSSSSVGVDLGFEIPSFFPAWFPSVWITANDHRSLFRTFTTNKVVHRTGILKKTKSRDLQTINESEILAYDEVSGTPLLSKVKNEFGDDFYSYNIPAYYHYDQMGHAYRNINYNFTAKVEEIETNNGTNGGEYIYFTPGSSIFGSVFDNLVRGDEVLVQGLFNNPRGEYVSNWLFGGVPANDNSTKKGYFLGFEYDANGKTRGIIHFPDPFTLSDFPSSYGTLTSDITVLTGSYLKLKVIRSGRRNHYGTMAANYLTKDVLTLINSVNPADNVTDLGEIDGFQNTTPNIIPETVLSATASLFKDDWNPNINLTTIRILGEEGQSEVVSTGSSNTDNPFLEGASGIWRPFKSYTYVGERKGYAGADGIPQTGDELVNNTSDDPKLYDDGVFVDIVPMFSWDLGNIEEYELNWEWVNEVTRFSPDSYEVENKNRLGIYSSALYGYDNSLTIAVGGNASYFELGAMDFETSEDNWEYGKSMIQTNMNFHQDQSNISSFFISDVLGIRNASFNGTTLEVVTDVLLSDFDATNYDPIVGLSLNSSRNSNYRGNQSYNVNGVANFNTVSGFTDPLTNKTYAKFSVNEVFITSTSQQVLPSISSYTGKVRVLVSRPAIIENASSAVDFSSVKAHTGKKSMRLSASVDFDQPQLKLIKDKKYIVSLWVSKSNTKVPTYEPGKYGNASNKLVDLASTSGNLIVENVTYGKIVEGWQKIDFEVKTSVNHDVLIMKFLPTGGVPIYVDDIRFSPKTGGITTYVYDANRFWLRASLNVDNYATFFYYDEEGNLTIKEQETEEGIFTITESRGHVSE